MRQAAERVAINTSIQGSAADLIKVAMVRVHEHIQEHCPDVELLLQIHDELVFELPESQAAEHAQWIRRIMSQAIPLSVPVIVDIAWGKSWLQGKHSGCLATVRVKLVRTIPAVPPGLKVRFP